MPKLALILISVFAGILAGLALTYAAVQTFRPAGVVQIGPWEFAPRAGSPDVDPYTRAATAVRGELPLGIGEGMTMVARVDSAGAPLDAGCDYRVEGQVPGARFWSLAVFDPAGRRLDRPGTRHALTSSEVLRGQDGALAVDLSHEVHPGNWLPLVERGAFRIVLRLYDTPLSASATALAAGDLLAIRRLGCRR